MMNWLRKLVGDTNEKAVRQVQPFVERINALEAEWMNLSDEALRAKTDEFRSRLHQGETLDDLLPEAFATVRETARRTLGQRHYDVQLMGGIVLHQGKIAEMRTGEGKTLVATLPLYLNALAGRGCHLITVNDYLAKVGAGWMGPIYHSLGLSVGFIAHDYSALFDPDYIDPKANQEDQRLIHWRECSRREAYYADITYGTNNEFGFDYLRDNMVIHQKDLVQRELFYAIVDEVDNILIDEARTPLIISGPSQKSSDEYKRMASVVRGLKPSTVTEKQIKQEGMVADGDFMIEERSRSIVLTESGIEKIERLLGIPEDEGLYDPRHYELTSFVENALRAEFIYHRDKDYMVRDGEVLIVDEFTGRPMPGRRWSDGLHQAVEAKEGVKIRQENATMATITFQNYFRMYDKLAGMTGTAYTEREEFGKIYNLDVVIIPTHRPMQREDIPDQIYRDEEAKFRAVIRDVQEMHKRGRPVLIGTTSVETSETLSGLFKSAKIPHNVLNAKHHEHEARFVAQAGRLGAVTIATNMAGRGTDILLGGNPDGLVEEILRERGQTIEEASIEERDDALEEARRRTKTEYDKVVALGGLHIIGTERHEARRIDNQLRGRAGRQGDPGSSQFYLSLEDELMRRFGRMETVKKIMERVAGEEHQDTPIQHSVLDKAIESAQSRVEGFNFDIRKHTVEFDDVMNTQRQVIYDDRRAILRGERPEELTNLIDSHLAADDPDQWDIGKLLIILQRTTPLLPDQVTVDDLIDREREEVRTDLIEALDAAYKRHGEEMRERVIGMISDEIARQIDTYLVGDDEEEWDMDGLFNVMFRINPLLPSQLLAEAHPNWARMSQEQMRQHLRERLEGMSSAEIEGRFLDALDDAYAHRETVLGEDEMRYVERRMMLHAIDRQWIDYLTAMDELRQTISLQAYAQRNPLVEFKRQAFTMFDQLKEHITTDIVYQILPLSFRHEEALQQQEREAQERLGAAQRSDAANGDGRKRSRTVRKSFPTPGRNDDCPCGSGRKFKRCHLGKEEELQQILREREAAGEVPQVVTPVAVGVAVAEGDEHGAAQAARPAAATPKVRRGRQAPPASGAKNKPNERRKS